jgi:uncharacterized protein (UPF0335 family)
LAARVEELERWRNNMRQDMHEISDKLEGMGEELKHLVTLIEERTDRRQQNCPPNCPVPLARERRKHESE